MNPHIPKWASTLGIKIPMDFQIFKGQNSLDWRVIYIVEKILKPRCLKWAHMTHLGTWNKIYGQKKGQESNCQFDFWPLKVGNSPNLLAFRWHATYCWKALDKGYKFSLDLTSIGSLNKKLWASKVARVSILGISGFATWEPRDKMTFGCRAHGQAQKIL
jgi:hypothetical protein